MFTTAGRTLATARTAGSAAGSLGGGDGGGCANADNMGANKRPNTMSKPTFVTAGAPSVRGGLALAGEAAGLPRFIYAARREIRSNPAILRRQVTKRAAYCQLAVAGNDCRLNFRCARQLQPGPTSS